MNERCCTCCGTRQNLEEHHVAGRRFSPITTWLCRSCHFYCTLAMVYERRWLDYDPLPRLWAGLLDIFNRFAECNCLPIDAKEELRQGEKQGLWSYRTCSAMAEYISQVPSRRKWQYQATEMLRLIQEVVNYVVQS